MPVAHARWMLEFREWGLAVHKPGEKFREKFLSLAFGLSWDLFP